VNAGNKDQILSSYRNIRAWAFAKTTRKERPVISVKNISTIFVRPAFTAATPNYTANTGHHVLYFLEQKEMKLKTTCPTINRSINKKGEIR